MWTGDHFEIDVEFIRHGKTASNVQKKYISYTDESLCPEGAKAILKRLQENYYSLEIDSLFVSGLKRTGETGRLIFGDRPQEIIEEINEISFGEFEGKSYNELKDNLAYQKWLESGGVSEIPGGESREEFELRQLMGLKRILLMAKDSRAIAVVAHGGTVMAIVDSLTELGYYDIMLSSGEKLGCHICYEIKGNINVSISHFSITYRDGT